jgi:carboxypeptidase PM20D1
VANPDSEAYRTLEKTIRQIWGDDLIVAPFFVIGGSDSKHFQARLFAPDTLDLTAVLLESLKEFEGFHGVNERLLVDEYGRTIGFFYTIFDNLQEQ